MMRDRHPARWSMTLIEIMISLVLLGIVSGVIENNAFTSITDRWTGGYAPPLLAPGPGIGISCTDDVCTVGTK